MEIVIGLLIAAVILFALQAAFFVSYRHGNKWICDRMRDRDEPPECTRYCVNASEACAESDGECLRFEPRRVHKKYNPRTGEVG